MAASATTRNFLQMMRNHWVSVCDLPVTQYSKVPYYRRIGVEQRSGLSGSHPGPLFFAPARSGGP